MKISIIGGGFVGLVTGACFADTGHDVTVIDVDPLKVDQINEKRAPIHEPGLENILLRTIGRNLRASFSYDPVREKEIMSSEIASILRGICLEIQSSV